MKKKNRQNRIEFSLLFTLGLLLIATSAYFFIQNIKYQKILVQKPTDIQIANVSTSDAWIYWKSSEDSVHNLYYKENLDSKEYTKVEYLEYHTDYINGNKVFAAHILNLEPNTQYQFKIHSKEYEWEDGMSFKTSEISEEVPYPEIVSGEGNDRSLLLVEMDGEKYMLDTQYHGTYAFDSKGKEYLVTEYSRYITGVELKEKLAQLLIPPVIAASGANCKTNIKVSSFTYPPTKAKTIDIINRWVAACPLGGYPELCYEDVYCRSLKYGINPAFVIAIWSHESGGSNYASLSSVEDFGIHGHPSVPVANFDKQIEHFLQNIAVPSYISSCKWSTEFENEYNPNLPKEMIMWAARYFKGQCSDKVNLKYGYEYISEINKVYGWYTNSSLTWPFTVPKSSSVCNYAQAFTNTGYNSCTSKIDPPVVPPDDPPVGDGVKKWLPVTGNDDSGKKISPEVDRKCEDVDGCTCIWEYNIKPGESTKDAKNGYTCTVSGQVVTTPTQTAKCGTAAITYKDTITAWPAGSTLCEVGNPNPSTVTFPKSGESVSWECVSGSNKKVCKATVTKTVIECCLDNQEVLSVEKGSCEGKVLKNVEENDCKGIDRTMKIQRGVNFLNAYEIVNTDQAPIQSAKSLMQFSKEKVILIAEFKNNTWSRVVKLNNGKITGSDFNLEPGKVYLIVSTENIDIDLVTVITINEKKEIDFEKLVGWNLIPSSKFQQFTINSQDILRSQDYVNIFQIALWNNQESKFEYTIRDDSGEIFGESLSLDTQEGIFVRGSK